MVSQRDTELMRFDSHRRDASVQFSGYLFAAVIPGHRLELLEVF
jgi:hypothetical protein